MVKNSIFTVSLRGEGVWHECQIHYAIKDTTKETLSTVRDMLEKSCNIKVYDFIVNPMYGTIEAATSRKDVVVYIEEIQVL